MVDIKGAITRNRAQITELAKKLDVSRNTVHYYINQGDRNSVETLGRIAVALGVPVSDLFEQPIADEQPSNVITCPHCGKKIKVEKEAEV